MEKNEKKNWLVNISEYHHRTMGLLSERRDQPISHVSHLTKPKIHLSTFGKIPKLKQKLKNKTNNS